MTPELGNFLVLALVLALVQSTLPLYGAWRGTPDDGGGTPTAYGQFAFLLVSFSILVAAFVQQDFSVAYVANNSNTLLPVMYRISAVWGAHEGSLLLWVLILAACGRWRWPLLAQPAAAGGGARAGRDGLVSVGFLLFTLLTSNPFERLLPAPAEGRDLNPLLQDFGLIIHPPMLYMGYVGFAVPSPSPSPRCSTARWTRAGCAGRGRGPTSPGPSSRSASASARWWAYYELGWGGWWFWDPVENASFMPWLVGTALIHSQAVTEKRGSFRRLDPAAGDRRLLAVAAGHLPGALGRADLGACLRLRSRARLFILVFLRSWSAARCCCTRCARRTSRRQAVRAGVARDPAAAQQPAAQRACAMVLLGTLYPLLADALGLGKISVGPPYFGLLFRVLMAPVVLLLPFGPFSRWQREVGPLRNPCEVRADADGARAGGRLGSC
jgi:cytochrome c-type biogenesis protein CcmF